MPENLISGGGSRGIKEVGAEFNTALTQNILKLAKEVTGKAIAETKADQFIEGRARVANGESMQDIKANQGVFDKVFGVATLEGAKAQSVVQSTDKHILFMQENMHKFKEQSTDEFIAKQKQYVVDNLITGDANTDSLITLASAEAIADAASIHSKQHALFVQESNKIEYENTLMGSSARMHAALSDDTISLQDRLKAVFSLQERLTRMPGQTDAAYRSSIADVMLSDLKSDRPELYNLAVLGELDLGEGPAFAYDPIEFDARNTQVLNEAFIAHSGRVDVQSKLSTSMTMAEVNAASINTAITDTEFKEILEAALVKEGADLYTTTQTAALFMNRSKKLTKDKAITEIVTDLSEGKVVPSTKKHEVANGLNLLESALDQQIAKLPKEQQEQATVSASRTVLDAAVTNNTVPSLWTAKWNSGLANPLRKDGTVNPLFLETLQHFNSKYEAKKELFASGMDSAALSNALGVKHLMRTYNVEADEAVLQYSTYQLSIEEAGKYIDTKAFNKKIDDFVEDPDMRNWFTDLFFGKWDEVKNKAQVTGEMKQYVIANIARTGDTGEGAWQGAVHDWMNTHEQVHGTAVNNYGIPLRERAGILNPEVSFDDATKYYLNTRAVDKFGPGFNPDNVQIRADDKFLTITPLDADGTFLPGLLNSSRRIPIEAVGEIFNTEVTEERINELVSNLTTAAQEGLLDETFTDVPTFEQARELREAGIVELEVVDPDYLTPDVPAEMKADPTIPQAVTPNLVEAVIQQESSGKADVISTAGAVGLMQLLPSTASEVAGRTITKEDLKNPELNRELGTKYLTGLVNEHGLENGLAAYNGGNQAIQPSRDCPGLLKWQCQWDNKAHTIPNTGFNETREYVAKILSNL